MEIQKTNKKFKFLKFLKSFYGVSFTKSRLICTILKVNPQIKLGKVTLREFNNVKKLLKNWNCVEYILKNDVYFNIKYLKEIKAYRGNRHLLKYPVRGQRTHRNSKTIKNLIFKS